MSDPISVSAIERGDEVSHGPRHGVVGVVAKMSRDSKGSVVCFVEWDDGKSGWCRLQRAGNRLIVHSAT